MRTMQRAGRPPWGRLLAGLLLSSGIALLARRRKALSRSGVPAAIVSGTTVFGLGGPDWGLGLIFFFVSSSLLSRLRAGEKERTVGEKFSKGAERDLLQVMANGGVATLCALGSALADAESQGTAGQDLWQAAFSGALATATADTWATEIGVLATQPPRLITSGRRVARGTSGGITSLGTLAAAAGALATGLVVQGTRTLLRRGAGSEPASSTSPAAARRLALPLAPIALLSGLGGSLIVCWGRPSRRSIAVHAVAERPSSGCIAAAREPCVCAAFPG